MKKLLFLFALTVIISGVVFADDVKPTNVAKNWISAEGSLVGAGARYERMINDRFSAGVNVYVNNSVPLFYVVTPLSVLNMGVDVTARYYPWGNKFFTGLGLGWHRTASWATGGDGIGLMPEIGWKFAVGRNVKFFIEPGIKAPITVGLVLPVNVLFGVVPYVGLGVGF